MTIFAFFPYIFQHRDPGISNKFLSKLIESSYETYLSKKILGGSATFFDKWVSCELFHISDLIKLLTIWTKNYERYLPRPGVGPLYVDVSFFFFFSVR
jgi:hypothetical protein